MHYLDNAATTPVLPDVQRLCCDTLAQFANPSSLYRMGFEAERVIDTARGQVAAALGTKPEEIVFTGSGSEGNNLAILGAVLARKAWAGNIVASGYEHPSGHKPLELLAASFGLQVTVINPGPDGNINPDELLAAVDNKTALVTAMHTNNETGALLDVAALATAVKARNSRTAVHVDGVQAFTKQPLCLAKTGIDSYTVSGHKIHAPKGVGAVYLRAGYHIQPPYTGGGQEDGRRPGTENTAGIAGFGLAAETAMRHAAEHAETVHMLDATLRAGLAGIEDIEYNTPPGAQPGILNISLPGVRSETMLHFLEERGVYLSAGSACSRGEPSHTLAAMGLKPKRIVCALRISFDGYNTKDDIDALLAGLKDGLGSLARMQMGTRRKGKV